MDYKSIYSRHSDCKSEWTEEKYAFSTDILSQTGQKKVMTTMTVRKKYSQEMQFINNLFYLCDVILNDILISI